MEETTDITTDREDDMPSVELDEAAEEGAPLENVTYVSEDADEALQALAAALLDSAEGADEPFDHQQVWVVEPEGAEEAAPPESFEIEDADEALAEAVAERLEALEEEREEAEEAEEERLEALEEAAEEAEEREEELLEAVGEGLEERLEAHQERREEEAEAAEEAEEERLEALEDQREEEAEAEEERLEALEDQREEDAEEAEDAGDVDWVPSADEDMSFGSGSTDDVASPEDLEETTLEEDVDASDDSVMRTDDIVDEAVVIDDFESFGSDATDMVLEAQELETADEVLID